MRDRFNKILISLATVALAAGALGACGGKQVPPAEGQCHDWREWVPPTQDERGRWTEGYCRNR